MLQLASLRKVLFAAGLIPLLVGTLWYATRSSSSSKGWHIQQPPRQTDLRTSAEISTEIERIITHLPPLSAFGERGAVSEQLANWIDLMSDEIALHETLEHTGLLERLEQAVCVFYPFLIHPWRAYDKTPLASLRARQVLGSQGIVIVTGREHFRYAAHLITNLRDVLGSKLPIEIAYAGEDDLPRDHRVALRSLGDEVFFLDVLSVFSDDTLMLKDGRSAIKPFAVLASRFQQVILMDADAVFLQKPETLLDAHQGFKSTGVLLFHDRLLRQNLSKDRAKWLQEQMQDRRPSSALRTSKAWTKGYAEEGDSGVVVVDKGPTRTMLGLLHVAWQNSKPIRDSWISRITSSDKETWWLGLELTGVPFVFEEHYGAALGDLKQHGDPAKVCGFPIAHLDEQQHLIWFNGGLLRNRNADIAEYWEPTHWMVDGEWDNSISKADMCCMTSAKPEHVPAEMQIILKRSTAKAKALDQRFESLIRIV